MGLEQIRAIAAQDKRLSTTKEIAALYGLGYSTVTKWRLTGEGPPYIKIGRKVMYSPPDVEEWLESKRRTSTSQVED
jgi:predicted DNA-binding transcriptional regulator AlpA